MVFLLCPRKGRLGAYPRGDGASVTEDAERTRTMCSSVWAPRMRERSVSMSAPSMKSENYGTAIWGYPEHVERG
jgi:hypothetical protein